MELLEALTFDGALHGLLVSTHIMWGEALVRRGQTSRAREVLGDLIGLSPAITQANDYPNAFLQMLDGATCTLEQSSGVLRIRSHNSVQVSLNKQSLGMLPLRLSHHSSIHVVRFETGTMGGRTRLVRVGAGEVVELAFELDSRQLHRSAQVMRYAIMPSTRLCSMISTGFERGELSVVLFQFGTIKRGTLLIGVGLSGTATRTKPVPLKIIRRTVFTKKWWKQRDTLPSIRMDGGCKGLSVQLALPSWLVAAAIRASLSNEDWLFCARVPR